MNLNLFSATAPGGVRDGKVNYLIALPGPVRDYAVLDTKTSRYKIECFLYCTLDPECIAVKVSEGTGTGNHQCTLLHCKAGGISLTELHVRV